MSTLPDIKEALNEYFKLKSKYETQIMANKKKIINKTFLSKREKKTEYNKLKPKCINCKRPGGTIFSTLYVAETDTEESYRRLQASCGILTDPCNLDINIQLTKIELIPQLLQSIEKEIKDYKNAIIEDKNKLLFGFISTDIALEKFDSVKEYINNLSSLYEQYLESYNKIVDNNERQQELNESVTNFYIEVQKIKDCITKMNETNNIQYARDAVNIYTTTIMPLLNTIRELKYNETYVWHNDDTNTCNLMQNKYSIANLSFSSSNDKVVAFDVGYSAIPKEQEKHKKKPIIILSSSTGESLSTSESVQPEVTTEPKPIYGDGLDGVKWNNQEYDKLWSKLTPELRSALITDHEWLQEFMDNCVKARASNNPCQFTTPKNLIIPPEIDPDENANFGIKIYNDAFNSLSKDSQKSYLNFYNEKNGVKNYTMLTNAMNELVAKNVKFGKGYI
jgi:hypothetical protein